MRDENSSFAPAASDEDAVAVAYWNRIAAAATSLEPGAGIDVTPAVMRRIAALEPVPAWLPAALVPAWQAIGVGLQWVWSPRPVSWMSRPAVAFAGAAALAGVAWTGARMTAPAVEDEPMQVVVQFRLAAEGAHDVALAGDFTGWQPQHQLYEISTGVWAVAVPLEPGVYDYSFVIDGESWRADPLAEQVADGFGGMNSRVAVFDPAPHRAL